MESTFYGNSWNAWLVATGAALSMLGALLVMRNIIAGRLLAFAKRTQTNVDDLAAELVRRTGFVFLSALGLLAGARLLVLAPAASRVLEIYIVVAVVVQIARWGNTLITHLVRKQVALRLQDDAASATSVNALGFLGRLLLWSVLVILGLDNLGVDITALVAGLGVGGIAVALALQNVLGDLFASLSIVLDKPFVIGDFIIVDDMLGTVEYVGLKTTRIRSLHGEQIVFSNADLLKSRVRNYKRMQERRVVFALGVTYDTAPEKVAAIPRLIRSIIEAQQGVRFDRAHFKSYGPFSLDFEIVYYVLDPDYNRYMDVQQSINVMVLQRFAAEGIEFAFPTRTLYINTPGAAKQTVNMNTALLPGA